MQTFPIEANRIPFAERDRWPNSGPIYGFLDDDRPARRANFWQRLWIRDDEEDREESRGPISPIHY